MNKMFATLSAVIVLACSLLIYHFVMDDSHVERTNSHSQLSLIDALHVGMVAAKKWNPEAVLLYVTSVDDGLGKTSGQEGTRSRWNLQVGAPANKRAVIAIRDGKVDKVIPGIGNYNSEWMVSTDKVKIDSTVAVLKSIRSRHLLPGDGWANGYHFILQAGEGLTTILVIGRDDQDQLQQIEFDAVTGRILSGQGE
ncbi:hypothetical protein M3661_09665 [Paenibacillus sp. MER 180]|uniref:hypothetical protein n=1 Tax=unclassified Paenibacillus TaxID=185978 RepID=UPI0008065253|nr:MULTISPECIES: hypothetical protein [unclassified Paenibacillus]MCM3290395.1 hypothetical protein [Paenibacillus sp. MER 180]OBY78504.1 hypothetical protein BBG47_16245 [Paenibacillus sp. KS1]